MNNEIMVSISCITYNHEPFIRETLDGILMQKTDFKYEILIHDDASTDNTVEIINEYQQKYPDIIKPIYQRFNQYSKGIKVSNLNYNRAIGKYIALCEGDDYWIDEKKLQKQVDYLEENPECTFCFHNAVLYDQKKNKNVKSVIPWLPENRPFFSPINRKYHSGELQLLGYIPTASFMFPRHVIENVPNWYIKAPVGDNAIKLLASSKGYAFFIHEDMCVYRINVTNSATTRWKMEKVDVTITRCDRFIEMLDNFNKFTDYKYNNELSVSKLTWEFQKSILTNNSEELKSNKYHAYFDLLPLINQTRIRLFLYFPKIYSILKKLKDINK